MSFLNATLLYGLLPLVALPLVIHLLNKKFPKFFYFSHVQDIVETQARRSRLFRWRHLILLCLRSLLILLLLLAILRPVLQRFGASGKPKSDRRVLLLLDQSLSMEFKGEGITSRQKAVLEAEKLIDSLNPADKVNIILVSHVPISSFVDFSDDHAGAKRFLDRLKGGMSRADFNLANAEAARLVTRDGNGAELYYFSDFQRKNWSNADFTKMPPGARLYFVDVGSKNRNNRAIIAVEMNQAHVLAGDAVPVEVTVGNFSAEPLNDRLRVVLDQKMSFDREVTAAPWSVVRVTVPVPAGSPGLHRCEVALPPDDLEADDKFYFTLPVQEKEEVLIVSDSPDPEKDAVFFLKTALNPYDHLAGSLLPKHVTVSELKASTLAGTKKIFLTRAGVMPEATADLIAKFIFGGGGMVYFLDGQNDRENLEKIDKATGKGVIPLRLGTHRSVENLAAAQQVIRGDFKSRFLKLFKGAARQDLALLEFYDFYQASSTGAGHVVLTYADESPAMALFDHGLGTGVLLNFSVSEFSSNLARQRIFPAWMQDIVRNLNAEEPVPAAFFIGDTIHAEAWRDELRNQEFRNPEGKAVTVRREEMGERIGVTFVPDMLGFYTLAGSRTVQAFGVNPSPEEADLRPIEKSHLPEQFNPGQEGHFVEGREDYQQLIAGRPIFHWFVFGVIGLVLVEMLLQLLFKRLASPPTA